MRSLYLLLRILLFSKRRATVCGLCEEGINSGAYFKGHKNLLGFLRDTKRSLIFDFNSLHNCKPSAYHGKDSSFTPLKKKGCEGIKAACAAKDT